MLDGYKGAGSRNDFSSQVSNNQPSGGAPRVNLFGANSKISTATINGKTIPMGGYWNSFKNPFFASHFRGYIGSV